MRRRILMVAVPGFILLVLLVIGASQFRLSALEGPGSIETYVATGAKRWFVARGARTVSLPKVVDDAESLGRGQIMYGSTCFFCHGIEGRRPIEVGLWMSPRAPDLDPSLLGEWTDAELFWIVKNGIRMTGMPGFEEIHSDEEIADLVRYLRSLGKP